MKKQLLALALAAAGSAAMAADQTLTLTGPSIGFAGTAPLLAGGDDVITFSGLAAGTYDVTVSLTTQFINLTTLTLNGHAVNPVASFGPVSFYGLQVTETSPFTLVLAGAVQGAGAAYGGSFTALPVPEPQTYAMLLAGLGAIGFMMRRRSKA